MNDIGFGIMCFGDDHYFQSAKEKEEKILQAGFDCTILTDNPPYFSGHYISYDREVKSYHDKMILPKDILLTRDICILIDADVRIDDYSFLNDLKTHKFKEGISYVDVLFNHPEKKRFTSELNLTIPEWKEYEKYAKSLLLNPKTFNYLPLMWEYFLVINPLGSNLKKFYEIYERLQIAKEFCDLKTEKGVLGNGEGVSISVAAKLSNTPCLRDMELYDIIKDKMSNISRKWMR